MNTDPNDPSGCDLDSLFAAARADKRDTARAEYGFETRLMARLAAERVKPTLWWAAWTWRLAPLFALVALGLTLWTHYALGPVAAYDGGAAALEWSAAAEDDLGSMVLDDFLSPS